MHAHRCKTCALNGVTTIWVHGDCQKGVEAAHICPRCGEKEWEGTPVLVGKLPTEQQRKINQNQTGATISVVPIADLFLIGVVIGILAVYGIVIYKYWWVPKQK